MIGRTLSHYQILEEIAAGGMGVVYRARDERLKREVAVKVLPPEALADEASRKRFRREALTLSQLNHPNIGTIFDFDSQEGVDFLVMELVGGMSLEDKVQMGTLPERDDPLSVTLPIGRDGVAGESELRPRVGGITP